MKIVGRNIPAEPSFMVEFTRSELAQMDEFFHLAQRMRTELRGSETCNVYNIDRFGELEKTMENFCMNVFLQV